LLLAYRLQEEVLADVPHRQWVFTLPKRLRVCFRFDRSLLGMLVFGPLAELVCIEWILIATGGLVLIQILAMARDTTLLRAGAAASAGGNPANGRP
jgi:hypothetical protein